MAKGLMVSVLLALAITTMVLVAFLVLTEFVGQEVMRLIVVVGVSAVSLLLICIFVFALTLVTKIGCPASLIVEGELVFSTRLKDEEKWLLLIKEEKSRIMRSDHRSCLVPVPFLDDSEYRPGGINFVKVIEERGGWKRAKIVPLPESAPLPGEGGLDSCTKGGSLEG